MLGVSPTGQKAVVAIEDHDFGAPAPSDDVFGELLGLGFGAASGEEHAGRTVVRPPIHQGLARPNRSRFPPSAPPANALRTHLRLHRRRRACDDLDGHEIAQ